MKQIAISAILLLVSVYTSAQIKWDGGGADGLWETAANWENDILPAPTDDVLIDNSLLAGSFDITLPAGAISTVVSTLTISPDAGENIRLILPAGNTDNAGLSITGTGDALVLNSGAILQNSSGAVAGPGITVTNTLRINNGGQYLHNTMVPSSGIASQLSTAAGTETGIFEYDVPLSASYEIEAAGRTYGNLILSANSSGSSNYTISSGAAALSINGNFQVNSNAHLLKSAAGNVVIEGNLTLQSLASLDISTGGFSPVLSLKGNFSNAGILTESGTGNPLLTFNGTGTSAIFSTGTMTGDNFDVIVNTTGLVRQTTSISFPHSLFVQAGTLDVSDASGNYTLGVKGTLHVAGLITESGTGAPRIVLNGTTNQDIFVLSGGSITGNQLDFRLNNAAGATLQTDLDLPYNYNIIAGNLTLGNFSLTTQRVILPPADPIHNHIITNGTGFLNIRNVGLAVVQFPVGIDGASMNMITISDGGGLMYSVRVMPGVAFQHSGIRSLEFT